MIIDPKTKHYSETYKLLTGIIIPRPIAFVSTISADGMLNLAPFSFFMGVGSNPPSLAISTTVKRPHAEKKDTLKNIEATGEFVVNVVIEDIAEQMNETATDFPPEINEFEVAGFTPIPSQIVKPPCVKESPINMECKIYRIVQVGDGSLGSAFVIIGEILLFHIQDDLINEGIIQVEKVKPLARLNQSKYSTLGKIIEINRK